MYGSFSVFGVEMEQHVVQYPAPLRSTPALAHTTTLLFRRLVCDSVRAAAAPGTDHLLASEWRQFAGGPSICGGSARRLLRVDGRLPRAKLQGRGLEGGLSW